MARCSYVNTVCRELSKLKFQQLFESSQDTVKDHSIETNRRLRRVCIRSFRKRNTCTIRCWLYYLYEKMKNRFSFSLPYNCTEFSLQWSTRIGNDLKTNKAACVSQKFNNRGDHKIIYNISAPGFSLSVNKYYR